MKCVRLKVSLTMPHPTQSGSFRHMRLRVWKSMEDQSVWKALEKDLNIDEERRS